MKKNHFLLTDYRTEQIFSLLRWIFLLLAFLIFNFRPIAEIAKFNVQTFNYLLIFGIIYMICSQVALAKVSHDHKIFTSIMKAGILFDYIALMWLLILSGGVTSPLFPISYLIVMHATIYWGIKGAAISCVGMILSYVGLFIVDYPLQPFSFFIFILNTMFLFIIGFFGALIVNRERYHYRLQGRYKDLMIRDYLTGLYNHRHFQDTLKQAYLNKNTTKMSVVLADIDNFKQVNDQYGHVTGDQVLMKIGEMLKKTVPPSVGDCFRYGGEEFALVFYTDDRITIMAYLDSIFKELNQLTFTDDQTTFSVTMSIGLVKGINRYDSSYTVVKQADELLYKAKKNGKNQACFDCGAIIKGV
ncbi:GGDEF domain-containing protein [Bacillus weihaiensis]|uniref:GGDEF domain-containing protein n=1 Tax=Bacillus weihaiensis TaxID=1547283 RepID=UPI0023556359|nr:GGDEF domain-containing protein [Bacillus weihaiensis]